MIKVALKGLAGRKIRALLTAFAVIIGVSMVSGTFVLTDTMQESFDSIFETSYENTDVVVSGHRVVRSRTADIPTIPSSVLRDVRALPQVDAAAGSIDDDTAADVIGRDGKSLGGQNPTFVSAFDMTHPELTPFRLAQGDWPKGAGQITIDLGTAAKHDYSVGDEIGLAANGPVKQYRITGIATFGDVDSIGGAVMAIVDLPTAQALLHQQGQYDAISITAKDGSSPAEVQKAVQALVPANVDVKLAADEAKDAAKETNEGLSYIRIFLLGFGGIALFVGAFVIFNTLSITVAQRTREFATLRMLGGSRRQVLRSVLLEGLVIGAVASVIGLFLGLALAKGLSSVFAALNLDLPKSGTVFATRTVVVSLVLGLGITLAASLAPAMRATRVPPILAVREGSTLPRGRLAPFAGVIAGAMIAISVLLISYAMFVGGVSTKQRLAVLALGVLVLFVGVALISSRIVRPLATLVGAPAELVGGPAGRLARQNSVRNPGRTASTAAALMIGLALVSVVAVLGAGLRSADKDALRRQVRADYVVTAKNGFDPFPTAAGDAVAGVKGVETVSHVQNEHARIFRSDATIDGLDATTITKVFHFDWENGSDAVLGD